MPNFTGMQWKQIIAGAVLAVAVVLVLRSLIRRDRKPGGFSFEELLLDDQGKTSSTRVAFMGSFGVTTWAMVFAMITKDNALEYFQTYIGAWVLAKGFDAFANRPKPGTDTTK